MDKMSELRQIFRQHNMSEREMDVTILLIKGLSNIEIGNQLFITEKGVKYHLTKIYKKLKVTEHFRPRYHLRYVYDPYVNPGRYQAEPVLLRSNEAILTVRSEKIKVTASVSTLPIGSKNIVQV